MEKTTEKYAIAIMDIISSSCESSDLDNQKIDRKKNDQLLMHRILNELVQISDFLFDFKENHDKKMMYFVDVIQDNSLSKVFEILGKKRMPIINPNMPINMFKQVIQEIYTALQYKNIKISKYTIALIEILIEYHDIHLLDRIISEICSIMIKNSGFTMINITSAKKLNDNDMSEIKDILRAKFTSKKAIYRFFIDEIISGIIIESDGKILDLSTLKKISMLKMLSGSR